MKTSDLELINCVAHSDLDALDATLAEWNFRTLYLRGENITGKETFLARAETDLPTPIGLRPHNWDAFSDCLLGGLRELTEDRVAIVWTDAHLMPSNDLQDFLIAMRIFTDVARVANTGGAGLSHEVMLHLFLVGRGSSFRHFPPE